MPVVFRHGHWNRVSGAGSGASAPSAQELLIEWGNQQDGWVRAIVGQVLATRRELSADAVAVATVSRMWAHSEATHEERRAFGLEVLEEADLGENRILQIKPRAEYRELFRVGAYGKSVTYGRGERIRPGGYQMPGGRSS